MKKIDNLKLRITYWMSVQDNKALSTPPLLNKMESDLRKSDVNYCDLLWLTKRRKYTYRRQTNKQTKWKKQQQKPQTETQIHQQ